MTILIAAENNLELREDHAEASHEYNDTPLKQPGPVGATFPANISRREHPQMTSADNLHSREENIAQAASQAGTLHIL